MKTLNTLIKLQKREVDKIRKELAELEERVQPLKDEHKMLGDRLEQESEFALKFPEAAVSFAEFAKKTIKRQQDLMRTIEIIQKAIDKKRDELQAAFGEQKKLEIALEQRQLAAFEEAKKQEIKKMDEIAIRGFSRKE